MSILFFMSNHMGEMKWNTQNELYKTARIIGIDTVNTYFNYSGGQRIRKVCEKPGGIVEERIYLGSYELYRKYVSSTKTIERFTVHISDDNGRIAMVEKRTVGTDSADAELTRYIYSNHLGSASLELNADADIISYEEYHPYGTTAYQAINAGINAVAKRYRYTGKERDEETGLYYHGARYYIPWLCRWCAVDPMESKYAGQSPYNYGFNNPIKWQDANGMDPDPKGEGGNENNTQASQDKKHEAISMLAGKATSDAMKKGQAENQNQQNLSEKIGLNTSGVAPAAIDNGTVRAATRKEMTQYNAWGEAKEKIIKYTPTDGSYSVDIMLTAESIINSVSRTSQQLTSSITGQEAIWNLDGTMAWLASDKGQHAVNNRVMDFASTMGFVIGMGISSTVTKGAAIESQVGKQAIVENKAFKPTTEDYIKLLTDYGEFDASTTLYRGTSGTAATEATGNQIFFTDDVLAAETYIKNGGNIIEIKVSRYSLFELEQNKLLTVRSDMHMGISHKSYSFESSELRQAVMKISKPLGN